MMGIAVLARVIFACCALTLMAGIFYLIRKGKIKEKHALLWIPLGILFLIFGIFPNLLVWISQAVHLHYFTVVMLVVILVFTLILLYFTAKISQLREDILRLAQEQAQYFAKEDHSQK